MKNKCKDLIIIILGWFFLILGFVGLFLPVLQGIIFMLIGLCLLSKKSPLARRLLNWLHHKYPRLSLELHKARGKAELYWTRICKHKEGHSKG